MTISFTPIADNSLLPFATAGAIRVPDGDDNSSLPLSISSIFENGLALSGRSAQEIAVATNGEISLFEGNGLWITDIRAARLDQDTRTAPPGITNAGIWVDFNTERDSVVITWNAVGQYPVNVATPNTYQVELIDRGNGDTEIIWRFFDMQSPGMAGSSAAYRATALQLVPIADWDEVLGNTGIAGVWQFRVEAGILVSEDFDIPSVSLRGTEGDDSLNGGFGDDLLNGLAGNDTIGAGSGRDTIMGGEGDNLLDGGRDDDWITAGSGADSIFGGHGQDLIGAGAGNDSISAGFGSDTVYAAAGDDTVFGDDGWDRLFGGDGADSMAGGEGFDFIDGGSGNDTIAAGLGNDTLIGGDGDDFLFGSQGQDVATGGAGADRFFVGLADGDGMTITDYNAAEGDVLLLSDYEFAAADLRISINRIYDVSGQAMPGGSLSVEAVTASGGPNRQLFALEGADLLEQLVIRLSGAGRTDYVFDLLAA